MNLKQELGEKIKRIRKNRGLTQEQLAELIDISSRNLSNIELGQNFPKAETLEKILKSLNITTEELFANEHIKSSKELLENIYNYLDKVKSDNLKLEKIYKIIKFLVDEEWGMSLKIWKNNFVIK